MFLFIPFLILLLSITIGWNITNKLSITLLPETKWAWILALGLILSSIIFFITFYFFGVDSGAPAGIAAQLICLTLTAQNLNFKKITTTYKINFQQLFRNKLLVFLLTILGLMLFTLFDTHIIQPKAAGFFTGESTYGDLPFHLTTISEIAYAKIFPPQNPFYAGLPLVYPYLVNLYSAVLVYFGFDLRTSIILPGMLLGLALVALIYELTYILTKKHFVAATATTFYFLQGGLGFYYFLKDNFFDLGRIATTLQSPSTMIEYSHLFRENIQWGNFLTRMIVPERSILFGIPAGIIVLRILFFRGENSKKLSDLEIIITSILLGFMPLIHTHTVLAFAVILPILFLFTFYQQRDFHYLKKMFLVGGLTILIALPLTPTFFGHLGNSESFFKWHFGWMTDFSKESFLFFWFKNTYLYIFFSLIVLCIPKYFNKQLKILQLSALVLFIVLNVALYSPYNWDNVKFLFWAGLFWSIASAMVFNSVFEIIKNKLVLIPLVLVAFTMISSALLSYYREVNLQYMLFSKQDIEVGNYFKQNTPNNSIVLTETIHNSPASNLAGREITMGYPGSLWVHGIKYAVRESQVKQIFAGKENASELINQLHINYTIIPNYQTELEINRDYFSTFSLVFENQNYKVYKLAR